MHASLPLAAKSGMACSLLAGAVLAMGGCVPTEKMELAYDSAAHASYMKDGQASIEGQGFLRKNNGTLVRCSGGEVSLAPATPYFREIVEIQRRHATIENGVALRKAHAEAIRKTQCDIEGNFTFAKLPAGKWFVQTRIIWQTADGVRGGLLVREVETSVSGAVKTILADQNLI